MVSYTKFVGEKGFDRDAFSAAVDEEIKDWEGRGMSKAVIGTAFTKKSVEDADIETKKLAKEDDETVDHLLSLTQQKEEKK